MGLKRKAHKQERRETLSGSVAAELRVIAMPWHQRARLEKAQASLQVSRPVLTYALPLSSYLTLEVTSHLPAQFCF